MARGQHQIWPPVLSTCREFIISSSKLYTKMIPSFSIFFHNDENHFYFLCFMKAMTLNKSSELVEGFCHNNNIQHRLNFFTSFLPETETIQHPRTYDHITVLSAFVVLPNFMQMLCRPYSCNSIFLGTLWNGGISEIVMRASQQM